MSLFIGALWSEAVKARRSRVPLFTALGFSLAPLMGGLFMFILQDPDRARSLGIVSAKAQLVAGVADWPTFIALLAQATAVGGALVFGVATTWIFGREFADGTAKDLLAVATPRSTIVAAKFTIMLGWGAALTALVLAIGYPVGATLDLPGGSSALLARGVRNVGLAAGLTLALMPAVALVASAGRGYLAAFGWIVVTLFLAQIVAATGWGDWFPWSVPALYSGVAGPRGPEIGLHSYAAVAAVLVGGLAGTFVWWRQADQVR